MARKVNATFQGSTRRQTDPGYWTQTEVIENAVGDTALTHDMLTGDNSPSTTINHTGSGAGTPLGVPLGARAFWMSDQNDSSNSIARVSSSVGSGGAYEMAYLFMMPVYLPEGETGVNLRISGIADAEGGEMVCKNTSWADAGETGETYGQTPPYWEGQVRSLTGGALYFIGMKIAIGPVEPIRRWHGVSVYFPGEAPSNVAVPPEQTDANWPQVPVNSQSGASSSTIIDQEDFDASMFADDTAYHAFLLDRLNKNQNALCEFMTGSPAGRNAAYVLTPSSGDDPVSSAFHDHSDSTHTNEGHIDFPLFVYPFGAVEAQDTNPDYATDFWGAPAATSTGQKNLADIPMHFPDFPDQTTNSRLKVAYLFTSPDGTQTGKTSQTFYAQCGGGTERNNNTLQWMGSTDWGYVVVGGTGSRIDFPGGEAGRMVLSVSDTAAGVQANAIRIVGACAYFDRDG